MLSIALVETAKGTFMSITVKAAFAAAIALALLPATGAQAQQKITIGTAAFPGSGDNAFPFAPNFYAAGGEFQEIYSSADFSLSGPVTINDIAFASSSRYSAGASATYDVTIGLSNTTATVNGTGSDFAANKGSNFQTVFSGPLVANLTGSNSFDLVFPTSPFQFDPSKGNLLFDIVFNSSSTATGPEDFIVNYSGQTRRVFQSFGTGSPSTDQEGLYTQFTVSPAAVPEASTTVSLGLLLILGAGVAAFKQKRGVSGKSRT